MFRICLWDSVQKLHPCIAFVADNYWPDCLPANCAVMLTYLQSNTWLLFISQSAQEFERSGCDYSFEVYIEAPLNAEAIAEIKLLRHSIPNAVVMVDTDLLWTWQMMASADVLVLSSSMFSASAALLNPDGVVVQVPEERYSHRAGEFMMGHWLKTASDLGDMTSDMLQRLQARLGVLPF